MIDGKWLSGLRADMPVVAAARHVLLVRLAPVRDLLPQAVFQADEDVEHVHQLRVSTRRAAAALRIFADCLPAKAYDRARKQLRKVRRGAGAARDWDVFLDFLGRRQSKTPAPQRPGLDMLLGIGHGERMAAQAILVQATQKPPLDFDDVIQATVAALQAPPNVPPAYTLGDLAGPLLSEHLRVLDQAVLGDLTNYEHLHQVRIAGKHLRYAMEVFECCYDDPFRDTFYQAIEEMQDVLGEANDSYVGARRLEAIRARIQAMQPHRWKRYRPGIEAILRYHERNLPRKRRQFLKWWHDWQRSGTEATFTRVVRPDGTG